MSYQNNNWPYQGQQKSLVEFQANKAVAGSYFWMCFGVLVSALSGVAFISLDMFQYIGAKLLLPMVIVQLGLVFVISAAINKLQVNTLKALFLFYSALTGVTLSYICALYPLTNVVMLFVIASLGFASLAIFGATTKKNLGFLGTFCTMGLFMIIGAGLVSLFVKDNAMLLSFRGWAGIFVFAGLTAYDSQRLKTESMQVAAMSGGNSGAINRFMILGALTMYLNFLNLFISLLQIFGGKKD